MARYFVSELVDYKVGDGDRRLAHVVGLAIGRLMDQVDSHPVTCDEPREKRQAIKCELADLIVNMSADCYTGHCKDVRTGKWIFHAWGSHKDRDERDVRALHRIQIYNGKTHDGIEMDAWAVVRELSSAIFKTVIASHYYGVREYGSSIDRYKDPVHFQEVV